MSEIMFGTLGGSSPAPVVQEAPVALAEPAQLEVARPYSDAPSLDNVILPHLSLVHPLSKSAALFPAGGITFGESTLLYQPAINDPNTGAVIRAPLPPVHVTVLKMKPERFVEKVEGGKGSGIICNSVQAVVNAGGTLDWSEWQMKKAAGMKLFQVLAEALVAIARPEHMANDGSLFVYNVDGKQYTLGIWSMKGSAYTEAAKKVLFYNRLSGCLVNGYPTFGFSLTTKFKPFKTANSCWVPVVVPAGKSSEAFLKWANTEVLGNK